MHGGRRGKTHTHIYPKEKKTVLINIFYPIRNNYTYYYSRLYSKVIYEFDGWKKTDIRFLYVYEYAVVMCS